MTSITINIDAKNLGIIRVALLDALAEAESCRRALDGLEEYAVGLASVTHRLEVLESVRSQIWDQELTAREEALRLKFGMRRPGLEHPFPCTDPDCPESV